MYHYGPKHTQRSTKKVEASTGWSAVVKRLDGPRTVFFFGLYSLESKGPPDAVFKPGPTVASSYVVQFNPLCHTVPRTQD